MLPFGKHSKTNTFENWWKEEPWQNYHFSVVYTVALWYLFCGWITLLYTAWRRSFPNIHFIIFGYRTRTKSMLLFRQEVKLYKYLFIYYYSFLFVLTPGNLPVTVETLEARPHPCLGPASAVTDASPFFRIKEALPGKSPAPLVVLPLTLPALDQTYISHFGHRSCKEGKSLFLLFHFEIADHTLTGQDCKNMLSLLLMSFLTLQMQPGISADYRPPW